MLEQPPQGLGHTSACPLTELESGQPFTELTTAGRAKLKDSSWLQSTSERRRSVQTRWARHSWSRIALRPAADGGAPSAT